jgi:hypothetical protein
MADSTHVLMFAQIPHEATNNFQINIFLPLEYLLILLPNMGYDLRHLCLESELEILGNL